MKGDSKVIEFLNEALKNELTAINQYWLHYRMLDNLGVSKLAEYERHESIDEMKHGDKLAERIFFLDGLPNFQMLGRLRVGESVEEILKADLDLEYDALPLLKDAIAHCESVRDYVSRDLFAEIETCFPDAEILRLEVDARNAGAIAFFQAHGMREIDRIEVAGDPAPLTVVLEKPLGL